MKWLLALLIGVAHAQYVTNDPHTQIVLLPGVTGGPAVTGPGVSGCILIDGTTTDCLLVAGTTTNALLAR